MSPTAFLMMYAMISWAKINLDIDAVVTETFTTIEEDQALNRVSDSHRTGRAFDISARGWSEAQIQAFIDYFTDKYGHMGALNYKGEESLIVFHDSGTGPHFHVQLHRRFIGK